MYSRLRLFSAQAVLHPKVILRYPILVSAIGKIQIVAESTELKVNFKKIRMN